MCIQNEHDLAQHYFSKIDEGLGFTYNVSTNDIYYYVSFNKDDKKLNGDVELKNFKNLFVELKLASEGWCKFKYRIDKAPSWSGFDFELIVFSERDNVSYVF